MHRRRCPPVIPDVRNMTGPTAGGRTHPMPDPAIYPAMNVLDRWSLAADLMAAVDRLPDLADEVGDCLRGIAAAPTAADAIPSRGRLNGLKAEQYLLRSRVRGIVRRFLDLGETDTPAIEHGSPA
jgi:hypothetical protein